MPTATDAKWIDYPSLSPPQQTLRVGNKIIATMGRRRGERECVVTKFFTKYIGVTDLSDGQNWKITTGSIKKYKEGNFLAEVADSKPVLCNSDLDFEVGDFLLMHRGGDKFDVIKVTQCNHPSTVHGNMVGKVGPGYRYKRDMIVMKLDPTPFQ